jgi:hypothetical protein
MPLRYWFVASFLVAACDGESCMFNSQCAAGSYCEEGVCVAGCAIDADCAADETCTVFGMCVARPIPDAGCDGRDDDGDGYCVGSGGGADCDDSEPTVHPGAPEVCTPSVDGSVLRDEDCSGLADDGCPYYFGEPHPVVELTTSGGNHWYPRVSDDGLSMLLGASSADGTGDRIHVATRADPTSRWSAPEPDPAFSLWTTPFVVVSVRGDGLEAYAQRAGTEIVRGTRASTADPFSAPELVFSSARHPFLSADGLELYVEDLSVTPAVISRATRTSTTEPFTALMSLGFLGATSRDYAPYLTPDGTALIFARFYAGVRRLFIATRASLADAFDMPLELTSFHDPHVEGPFLSAATRELYYSAYASATGAATVTIFRAEVCRDGPCARRVIACPGGVRSDDGLHCYTRVDTPRAWMDAETDCVSRGGHLASVHHAVEAALVDATGAAPFWLGATDLAGEGTLAWSSGEPVTRTLFAVGQPDDTTASSNCVQGSAGSWDDVDCATTLAYVCETELWPTW